MCKRDVLYFLSIIFEASELPRDYFIAMAGFFPPLTVVTSCCIGMNHGTLVTVYLLTNHDLELPE